MTISILFPRGQAWAGEEDVKLQDFIKVSQYVDWPEQAMGSAFSDFVFGVIGDNDFYNRLLDMEKGKWFNGHPVAVREVVRLTAKDLGQCQVLFIADSQKGRLKEIFSALKPYFILTVSDIRHFAQKGGMVEFIPKENQITFAINTGQVEKTKLKISSRLLQLATIVNSSGE
jgi:hypothetical protein